MTLNPYKRLAERLDALPNGFPAAPDGVELRLLQKLYQPEEAILAAELRLTLETADQITSRLSESGWREIEIASLPGLLKSMARKGLINAGRTDSGLAFGLMPFVVGIYEAQIGRMDAELARLFEGYHQQVFRQVLAVQPTFHRVIPVGESIPIDIEIRPYESASDLVNQAQSWGVLDCICRVQKALIGEPCPHPVDVCMALSKKPGVFAHHPVIRDLTREQSLATLQRAAQAGLVHTVSNVQAEISYICNCCTCGCGLLRAISKSGIANAVAHSAFINQVDEDLCTGCEACLETCQFDALSMQDNVATVSQLRCVGCGVCVLSCEAEALILVRRQEEDVLAVPVDDLEWRRQRSTARGLDLKVVL